MAYAPQPQPQRVEQPLPEDGVSIRDNFIASARRAARQAADAPRPEAVAAPHAVRPAVSAAIDEADLPPPPRARAAGKSRGPSKLALALMCCIAIGAGFVIVKSTFGPAKKSAVERQGIVPPTGKAIPADKKKMIELEDADEIIEAPRSGTKSGQKQDSIRGGNEPAAAPPKRSSFTAPPMIGEGPSPAAQAMPVQPAAAVATDGGSIGSHYGVMVHSGEIIRQNPMAISQQVWQTPAQQTQPVAPVAPAALPRESTEAKPGPKTYSVAAATAAKNANDMPPLAIGPNSLRTAAAKGDPSAEFEVGARFADGRGVPQDLKQAVTWYQRSAAQGFAPAQYRLGTMFERGLGVKADIARARVWYQRAADQGNVRSMHNLAVLGTGRDGAEPDYATASRWFKAAADHGLTDSQFNLAVMYDGGLGMETDPRAAYKWFALAGRAGDQEAVRRREAIKAKLTPIDVRDLDAEIDAWRPRASDEALNDPRIAGEMWKSRAQ